MSKCNNCKKMFNTFSKRFADLHTEYEKKLRNQLMLNEILRNEVEILKRRENGFLHTVRQLDDYKEELRLCQLTNESLRNTIEMGGFEGGFIKSKKRKSRSRKNKIKRKKRGYRRKSFKIKR